MPMNRVQLKYYTEYLTTGQLNIRGRLFGARLENRGANDTHICLRLMMEDDGYWHETNVSCSSFWIDDLIDTLQRAKWHLATHKPDMYNGRQCGWKFKRYKP